MAQTFSREDARRLIALIPVTPRRRFSSPACSRAAGLACVGGLPGSAMWRLDGEGERKAGVLERPGMHRIGGYVVNHTPGEIVIELMWSRDA